MAAGTREDRRSAGAVSVVADFDADMRAALEQDETFQGILEQLRQAASAEVLIRDTRPCTNPKCGCKHHRSVSVPDYKLKLQIIEFLSNRGVGRPGQVEGGGESGIVFERVIYMGGDE